MKKILAILVACAFAVSCQWWHETFSSPEDCVKWYAEQVEEALSILKANGEDAYIIGEIIKSDDKIIIVD